jgi:hypothetical protein
VYGSNYPPVGEYLSASEISFTGTPEYKVVLERSDKSTYTATVGKNEPLSIPSSEAALSFTDKTGAPGQLNSTPRYAASTKTWTIPLAGQIWSDAINIPTCEYATFATSTTVP